MAAQFLTKKSKSPDEDNWSKMKRVLKYPKVRKHIKLTFRVDYLLVTNWCIYASYNKDDDFRGYTGFIMSLGKWAVISLHLKHTLNMKRST